MFWSLILVVSIKYLILVMRIADRGAGGIMVMMALRSLGSHPRANAAVMALGLFGVALFYGDGNITPAISVLSTVEGLAVGAPALGFAVVPVSLAVLVWLFVM